VIAGSAASTWLGVELVSAGDGEAVLTMPARAEMANRRDVVHGGFIAFLADSAMGRAMSSALGEDEGGRGTARPYMSFDLKLSFVSTGRIGERLTAVAKVLHAGRRTGVAECRVEGEDGRLVATATATFIVKLPSGNNE
jgi:acyl-CoA thioesterase